MSSKPPVPSAEAVQKATQSMVTPELADYMVMQVEKILKANKLTETCKGTLDSLKEMALAVKLKFQQRAEVWRGDKELSTFQNLQIGFSEIAKEMLDGNLSGAFNLIFATNEKGQFLRGYVGGSVDSNPDKVNSMDRLFNAWLAKHGVVSEEGSLYKADTNGVIETSAGKRIPVDTKWLENIIKDGKDGFAAYLISQQIKDDKGNPVVIDIIPEVYPEELTEEIAEAEEVDAKEKVATKIAAAVADVNQPEEGEAPRRK